MPETAEHARWLEGYVAVAKLEGAIFKGLPTIEARTFSTAIRAAGRPEMNLSQIDKRMRLLILTDETIGLRGIADPAGLTAIDQVAGLLCRELAGYPPTSSEWAAAAAAARAAARAAADAAEWAAAGAGASAAASDAAWRRIAELFLIEIAAAPIIEANTTA